MRPARVLVLALAVTTVHPATAAAQLGPPASPSGAVPGQVIVQFRAGTSASARGNARQAADVEVVHGMRQSGQQLLEVQAGQTVAGAVRELEADPRVAFAQPNRIYHAAAVPNDPLFGQLWGQRNTGQVVHGLPGVGGTPGADADAALAWDRTTGSRSVLVAVADTGIAYDHPDLAANVWSNPADPPGGGDDDGNGIADDVHGANFCPAPAGSNPCDGSRTGDPRDENGHGTHVAGTIGAVGDNGVGVAGMNWQVSLMAVRVLNADGSGTSASIADGFDYAGDHGARVVNVSLGAIGADDAAERQAIHDHPGTLYVVAAGNDGTDNDGGAPHVPCNLDEANLVCVAATTQDDQLADFSNVGATSVDLGAPGTNILSTWASYDGLHDGFEADDLNVKWVAQAPWGRVSGTSDGGSFSLADSPAGGYAPNVDASIRTAGPVPLSGGTCRVSFDLRYDTQPVSDRLRVEISPDNVGWTSLASLYGSSGGQFQHIELDLPTGTPMLMRFRFTSDGSDQRDGVYIDNVRVGCIDHSYDATDYVFLEGTSMATPQVAGAAALALSLKPSTTVAELKSALLSSGDAIPALHDRTVSGRRLNVFNLLNTISPPPGAPPQLDRVGTFSSPTFVTAPRGDTHRLFIVERAGRIQVLDDGVKHEFLDLTNVVQCCTGERGLASMAFAPDYETSGRFYVQYTAQVPDGAVTVAEYRRSASDPDVADPASGRVVLSIPHDQDTDHDGGQLQFGPDGALYISVGDAGGNGGDPAGNGQNLTSSTPPVVNGANHHPLLGKILRIDPRSGSPYSVPAGNPFPAPAREVYAYGLRNPWRFSFDRLKGDMVVADVGQDRYEEVDFAPAPDRGLGANYGWNPYEGLHTYPDGALVTPPFPVGFTFPVLEKSHAGDGFCSITGGYVVRDPALTGLAGQYVYGDFCTGALRAASLTSSGAQDDHALGLTVAKLTSFGEDACARVYAVSLQGDVYRISNGAPSSCTAPVNPFPDVPTVSVGDVRATEGDSGSTNASFVVSLSSASSNTITVHHATTNGTATAPADYTSTSGDLSFAPGQTSKTVDVPVRGDQLDEDDETFSVDLSSPTDASIADGHGVGTIADDDPAPAVSILGGAVTEGDAGTATLSYTATLDAPSGRTVTVAYATADGSAHQPEDYSSKTGTLTFAPGETTQRIDVTVVGDTRHEGDETVAVDLSNPANASLGTAHAVGTIVDDDPAPALSIADASVTEGDSGTTELRLSVSLSAASGNPVSVDYATADGTAVAPADYSAASGTLTFAPGDTSKTIVVSVKGDALDELDETLAVHLSSASEATIARADAVGTIRDDDPAPALSVAGGAVGEGDAGSRPLTFTVQLSAPSGRSVTVDYHTADGTAEAPADYTATSGTLTFAPGDTSKTVDVPVIGDTLDEGDEDFTFALSAPSGATLPSGPATATIQDDDDLPSLSVSDASVVEGGSASLGSAVAPGLADPAQVAFAIELQGASALPVTVHYATADGTARAPDDYQATSGDVTFTPGQTVQTVAVPVTDDQLDENDETFSLALSAPAHAKLGRSLATGTIVDDDAPPSVSISDASVGEGDSGTTPMQFVVSLSAASEKTVTVRFATSDAGATAGVDYARATGEVSFAPGETRRAVGVGVAGDKVPELDEALRLGPVGGGTPGTGTIRDDDPAATALPAAKSARLSDLFCSSGRRRACTGISVGATYGSAGTGTWTFVSRDGKRRVALGRTSVRRRASGRARVVFQLPAGRRSTALRRRVLEQRHPMLYATLTFKAVSGKLTTAELRMRLRR